MTAAPPSPEVFLMERVSVGRIVDFGDVRYGTGCSEYPTVIGVAGGGASVAAYPHYGCLR